ncbi:MAG: DUF4007 family protein [Geobacteraceae bacterium]|nr:DUF4007 family protein [Desulfuromonadaceae bacterium]NTV49261.1 DUF4007 family protein [Geobacteraceae bacterium]NTW78739.1 DUF4007 family protein [Geobacteraceae bacterium]
MQKSSNNNEHQAERFSFSGHETFPLRVAWLPKAVSAVSQGKDPFTNPRDGMRLLGLGKNMVMALECWSEYFGVIFRQDGCWQVTEFGESIFGTYGADPFLEDQRTIWLLHWRASTNTSRPFFAWHWLINMCHEPEFTFSEALKAFQAETDTYPRSLSETTLRQHLDVFLRTYVASESVAGRLPEDLLDSPLSSLGFIRKFGERRGDRGRDPLYSIDVQKKNSIPNELFRYCLHDWWNSFAGDDQTVLFSSIAFGRCSPGRVFRMPEAEVRDRLVLLAQNRPKEFTVLEGANQRVIQRLQPLSSLKLLLSEAYKRDA